MNLKDLIATDEICTKYRVERTFIQSLNESGLLEVIKIEHTEYLHCDKIGEFEKMHRLHRDLNINLEGIEAIQHLLKQIKQLQKDNRKLRNRLSIFEK